MQYNAKTLPTQSIREHQSHKRDLSWDAPAHEFGYTYARYFGRSTADYFGQLRRWLLSPFHSRRGKMLCTLKVLSRQHGKACGLRNSSQ